MKVPVTGASGSEKLGNGNGMRSLIITFIISRSRRKRRKKRKMEEIEGKEDKSSRDNIIITFVICNSSWRVPKNWRKPRRHTEKKEEEEKERSRDKI